MDKNRIYKLFSYILYILVFFIVINWNNLNYWKWIVLSLGLVYEFYINFYLRKNYNYHFGITKERRKQNLKTIEESGALIPDIFIGAVLYLFLLGFGFYLLFLVGNRASGWLLIIFSTISIAILTPTLIKNKDKIF